jgi:hypothetical protein
MRSTPVSLVTLDGARYIVSSQGMEWVKNARAAGWVTLERAGRRERATLSELAPAERGPILRAFWHKVPQGRPFIARLFGLPSDTSADDFEAAAPRCPVFRLDPPGLVVEGQPERHAWDPPGTIGSGLTEHRTWDNGPQLIRSARSPRSQRSRCPAASKPNRKSAPVPSGLFACA